MSCRGLNFAFSIMHHVWVAAGSDDRMWKIEVTEKGTFRLSESGHTYGIFSRYFEAELVAETKEHQLWEESYAQVA